MKIPLSILFLTFIAFAACRQPGPRIQKFSENDSLYLKAQFFDSVNYIFVYISRGGVHHSQVMQQHPSGLPSLVWSDRNWVYMKGGCGTTCTYAYLLPLRGNDSVRTYAQPAFIDKKRHIIVYCQGDLLAFENYVTGARIQAEVNAPAPHCNYYLEDIRIENHNLIMKSVHPAQHPNIVSFDITPLLEERLPQQVTN